MVVYNFDIEPVSPPNKNKICLFVADSVGGTLIPAGTVEERKVNKGRSEVADTGLERHRL